MLKDKCANNLRQFLQETGDNRMILAVSGGPDSVCLLDMFSGFRSTFKLDIHVAHLNHKLRGAASDDDARFVQELCRAYTIPFHSEECDIRSFAEERRYSIEEAARIKRYEYFCQLALQLDIATIVTGHHADDQVETVLMRILNGSSPDSLGGMSSVSPLFCDRTIRLFRPLLTAWRREIIEYVSINKLSYRIDQSNLEDTHIRNRVRNRLIPLLCKEFAPALKDNLLQTAAFLREDAAYFAGQLTRYSPVTEQSEDSLQINVTALPSEPSLRRRMLLKIFRESRLPVDTLTFHALTLLDNLLQQHKPSFFLYLKNDLLLQKDRDTITVRPAEQAREEASTFSVTIPEPATISLSALHQIVTMRVYRKPENFRVAKENNPVHLDADKVAFPVTLRSRRSGDLFYPFGSTGSKRIKDYLIDKKIARFKRNRIPLFTDAAGNIFWVGRYQIDSRFRVTEATRNILEVSIE